MLSFSSSNKYLNPKYDNTIVMAIHNPLIAVEIFENSRLNITNKEIIVEIAIGSCTAVIVEI